MDVRRQRSDERSPLPDMSLPSYERGLVQRIINDQKFLEEDLCQCCSRIRDLECDIQLLGHVLSLTTKEMLRLKAGLGPDYSHVRECPSETELVMKQIACKSGTAAAVICSVFQSIGKEDNDLGNDILGVVGCLGTVQTNSLSRILAKYLGEVQMLAIVCKSSAFASALVKYGPHGEIDSAYGLHALATNVGLPINRQYLVICLDNIRAYAGEVFSDSKRILALPDPILSNGRIPPGYLGYAVNMIDPDVSHWFWKSPSGHGLRETLFYHLFGQLQVYANKEDMIRAISCITDGAVSLDGGIIMKNGVFSFGNWPDIQFPVVCSQKQRHGVEIMKEVEVEKQQFREAFHLMKEAQEEHAQTMKEFWGKHEWYNKFLNENGPLLSHCYRLLGLTPNSGY